MKKQTIIKAFANAFNGIKYFFLHEKNGKIQLCVASIVVFVAAGMDVSTMQWIALLFCIAMVLAAEMMNTAIEHLCNMIQEEYHPVIKIVKDVSAGAVLFISIISAIIGCIIFIPKILNLLC